MVAERGGGEMSAGDPYKVVTNAVSPSSQSSPYGPFHRLANADTQSDATALLQQQSGEVWGSPARGSSIPSVKAYRGTLPSHERGIEFRTIVEPQKGSGTKYEARWYYPQTPGVLERGNGAYAAIPVVDFVLRQ